MNIVFFAHPVFLNHQSMNRYVNMLANGMQDRGHRIEIWSPKPYFFEYSTNPTIKKWLGYIDQYIIFPRQVRKQIKKNTSETLFVFTDHALGPWVSLLKRQLHIVHCHDFLAQRSALNEICENKISWTGRQYQKFIRKGYTKANHFISVSQNTKTDLKRFLKSTPALSEVVYNGMNQSFMPGNSISARKRIGKRVNHNLIDGYILHIGGNQWYKNRIGVIKVYNAWRSNTHKNLPLLMIGQAPDKLLTDAHRQSPFSNDIYLVSGIEDEYIHNAYRGASIFLFPSLAEGFGWPIAEAMASGCPVITTNEAPMTEVAGEAAFFISRSPADNKQKEKWAKESALVLNHVLDLSDDKLEAVKKNGIENAKRFDTNIALTQIENIYKRVLNTSYCR